MATIAVGEMSVTRQVAGEEGDGNRYLPAQRTGSGQGLVLSDAVADHVGELLSLSEEAADAIRDQALADAELLMRTATRAAARQARSALAAIASESVPRLEARVSEMQALVDGVRGDLERLTEDLDRVADGAAQPMLSAVSTTGDPVARSAEERRALLVALNMANNGASREEAERYLVDDLKLPDPAALLDAVYGNVGAD